jgi:hypothetical protein
MKRIVLFPASHLALTPSHAPIGEGSAALQAREEA